MIPSYKKSTLANKHEILTILLSEKLALHVSENEKAKMGQAVDPFRAAIELDNFCANHNTNTLLLENGKTSTRMFLAAENKDLNVSMDYMMKLQDDLKFHSKGFELSLLKFNIGSFLLFLLRNSNSKNCEGLMKRFSNTSGHAKDKVKSNHNGYVGVSIYFFCSLEVVLINMSVNWTVWSSFTFPHH